MQFICEEPIFASEPNLSHLFVKETRVRQNSNRPGPHEAGALCAVFSRRGFTVSELILGSRHLKLHLEALVVLNSIGVRN